MPEDDQSPIVAAKPPVVNPIAAATSQHASTLKLKPVIRKTSSASQNATAVPKTGSAPLQEKSQSPSSTSSIEQLKSVTQKLKAATQHLPAQAILHKTGIVSESSPQIAGMTEAQRLASMNRTARIDLGAHREASDPRKTGVVDSSAASGQEGMTEAQRLASMNRTSRIELSSAIGASPSVSAVPVKTIRIKSPQTPAQDVPDIPDIPDLPVMPPQSSSKKTLKLTRPQAGFGKTTGKLSIKKLSAARTTVIDAPSASETNPSQSDDVPDLAATDAAPTIAMPAVPPGRIVEVSKGLQGWSMTLQLASCVAMGVLVYFLYLKSQLPLYLGGLL